MNRADVVSRVVWLDQVIAAAKEARGALVADLEADAKAEYEEQQTASTWRIKGVATVPQSVTNDAVVVESEPRFVDWVAQRFPTEVDTIIRPAFRKLLLGELIHVADGVCHIDGEVVPGVEFRAGGEFIGVSVRATPEAKQAFGAVARATLLELAAKDPAAIEAVPQ